MQNDLLSFSNLLGTISVLLMFVIWYLQSRESKETKNILADTNLLTQKLETEAAFKMKVQKLFKLRDQDSNSGYKLIYPANYNRKPLPSIHQGDFYAIHVLGLAIGINNMALKDIALVTQDCNEETPDPCEPCKGNIIYICSPQANPCLDYRYPYAIRMRKEHESRVKAEGEKPDRCCCKTRAPRNYCTSDGELKDWLKTLNLPCWFIYDIDSLDGEGKPSLYRAKKIQVAPRREGEGLQSPLKSGAEEEYINASKTDEIIHPQIVNDLGIFARLTTETGIHVIISGIHQYGTWIVADFMNNLLRKEDAVKDEKQRNVFMGDSDFVAIIEGYFNTPRLKVERSEVENKRLWVRKKGGEWARYDES